MMKKIKLNFNKKDFEMDLKVCDGFGRALGLMFSRKENAQALLFEFKRPVKLKIHSLFVFFPFVALWLDEENKIIDKKIVKPFKFSVSSGKSFYKLVEIPFSKKYHSIINILVGDSKV